LIADSDIENFPPSATRLICPLASLTTARALGQLVVGNALHDFKFPGALIAAPGRWCVFVKRHGKSIQERM
jgi:hypothetical protein